MKPIGRPRSVTSLGDCAGCVAVASGENGTWRTRSWRSNRALPGARVRHRDDSDPSLWSRRRRHFEDTVSVGSSNVRGRAVSDATGLRNRPAVVGRNRCGRPPCDESPWRASLLKTAPCETSVMTDPDVFVGLRLLGELHPESITTELGIRPSREFVKGQRLRSGRTHEHSGWIIDSDGAVEADTIEPHLDWLLGLIEPRAEELASIIASSAFGSTDCYWASVGTSGGPWISPTSMTRMGALGLPLIISFCAQERD